MVDILLWILALLACGFYCFLLRKCLLLWAGKRQREKDSVALAVMNLKGRGLLNPKLEGLLFKHLPHDISIYVMHKITESNSEKIRGNH